MIYKLECECGEVWERVAHLFEVSLWEMAHGAHKFRITRTGFICTLCDLPLAESELDDHLFTYHVDELYTSGMVYGTDPVEFAGDYNPCGLPFILAT